MSCHLIEFLIRVVVAKHKLRVGVQPVEHFGECRNDVRVHESGPEVEGQSSKQRSELEHAPLEAIDGHLGGAADQARQQSLADPLQLRPGFVPGKKIVTLKNGTLCKTITYFHFKSESCTKISVTDRVTR
jgi:hypothetical protein